MGRFDVLEVSLELVREVRGPLDGLRRRDPGLHDQLRRAVSSIALNVAEGNQRRGKDRLQFFRIAAGSAAEFRAGVRVAEAWGCFGAAELRVGMALLDRVMAMLWRLTH